MSTTDNEDINKEEGSDEEIINEEEAVKNILTYKTARYLALFLLIIAIVAFTISFIDFKREADQGTHVKFFFMELNIPKEHPDTVFVDKIVYMDTNKVTHDTIYKDDPRPNAMNTVTGR